MDTQIVQDRIKEALKLQLKRQNYTYADLAKVWGCSLPTVKRQLGSEELSLARLLEVLDWLGITLTELHKLTESDLLSTPKFTAKQNIFLSKNVREFAFLMKLYEGNTPEQLEKKYKLTPAELDRILLQLEKLDLIRVGSSGKVKPFHSQTPALDGLAGQVYMHRIVDRMGLFQKNTIAEMTARKARGLPVHQGQVSWAVASLSEKSYAEYLAKFQQLQIEMNATSKLEEKSLKKRDLKFAVTGISLMLCEPNDPNLEIAKNVLDSIFDEEPIL